MSRAVSDRVRLRDVLEEDLPTLFEHQIDPVATALADFPAREWDAFMAHWQKILRDGSVAKQTVLFEGRVAGNIVCFGTAGERLVGYWIGREFWGRGIASEALRVFLGTIAERPLRASVAKHNAASRRVLEKCGFVVSLEDEKVGGYILTLE